MNKWSLLQGWWFFVVFSWKKLVQEIYDRGLHTSHSDSISLLLWLLSWFLFFFLLIICFIITSWGMNIFFEAAPAVHLPFHGLASNRSYLVFVFFFFNLKDDLFFSFSFHFFFGWDNLPCWWMEGWSCISCICKKTKRTSKNSNFDSICVFIRSNKHEWFLSKISLFFFF